MSKQKGQSLVEFAFILPGLLFIFLGLVYGGILFMDYIQYNNAARAIARDATFAKTEEMSEDALEKKYFNPLTSLYQAKIKEIKPLDDGTAVKVTITLTRKEDLKLFSLLTSDSENEKDKIEFPPRKLKDIVYIMPIEQNLQE